MIFRGCPGAEIPLRQSESPCKVAILDRDGVVNVDKGYVFQREEFEWIPGFLQAFDELKSAGYKVVVATNQSGIGRGLYSEKDFLELSKWLLGQVSIDGICYCPHSPEENCPARKPSVGMLEAIDRVFCVDKEQTFFVGDKPSDMEAAAKFGILGLHFTGGNLYEFLSNSVLG